MRRVPLLAGSRITAFAPPRDALLLRPRAPREAIDVTAAVRDALRFPLSGPPLEALVPRAARATVVVEAPVLPIPGAPADPRQAALAAALDELERAGVRPERQTILVAGGLSRRAGPRELEALLAPARAREFRGAVEVHDVERPDLVRIGAAGRTPLDVHPLLVDTDAVVVVSAAETVLHGGAATLVAACGRHALRAAGAYSLLETTAAEGWELAAALERALAARVPVIGVSLVLNNPRLTGRFRDVPFDPAGDERLVRSPARRILNALPHALRRELLQRQPRELTAHAAFAGPPSVAHVEALLRTVELRGVRLDAPLDAIVVPVPWKTHHQPRERANPIVTTALALGVVLRLWRERFPVVDGGTAIVLDAFTRRFTHATQEPFRALFHALRDGLDAPALAAAERAAVADERALAAYRAGRACHPLLPFADWAGCTPALGRLGAVVVAGCRDAPAARTLGFVPTASLGAALTMAYGRAESDAPRLGILLAPPYFPLVLDEPASAPEG